MTIGFVVKINLENRFSTFFEETCHRSESNIAGDWIKNLSNDVLNDFISTLRKIDNNPPNTK